MKLRKFGAGHIGEELGYDLQLCIGWLESMVNSEEENFSFSTKGPKSKRINLVYDAIENLNKAASMSEHDQ